MNVSELIRKEYFNALYNQQNGSNISMNAFKEKYPDVYCVINSMYHKRVKVRKEIECMRKFSNNKVYFGALTFNEDKNKNNESSKKREVFNYLNQYFEMFLVVEEHGELNGRYHCHFVGVFKEGKGLMAFRDNWHSFSKIDIVKSTRSVARYLCNYIVKEVPRIRRNKLLIEVSKRYQKSLNWSNYGFTGLADKCVRECYDLLFLSSLAQ